MKSAGIFNKWFGSHLQFRLLDVNHIFLILALLRKLEIIFKLKIYLINCYYFKIRKKNYIY